MKIEDVEEETLCGVCMYGIKRQCQIGYKIENGEAADFMKDEYGFWGFGAGFEYPTIGLAVLDCEAFKRLHEKK
jgi:hypothetical protein